MRPSHSARAIPSALLALCLGLVPAAHAGSVDNRNNNSAEFIRNVSRNAATDGADVSIYNPAGAVKLEDGLHLSLANQTVAKFNSHSFKTTATSAPETFTSDIVSPVYPTAFALYKRDNWAGFAAFSFPGGGGELDYKRGSGTTFLLEANLRTMGLHADAYLRSLYYGFTMGGSYAPKEWVSISLAARTIYANTEITVTSDSSFAPGNTDKIIDHVEEARGYSGVFGVDFFPTPALIVGIRYEAMMALEWEVTKSSLNMENVVKDATTRNGYIGRLRGVLREPGSKFNRDLPAVLGLGVGYKLPAGLRADLSGNIYFNADADWGGKESLHENGQEYALGLEWSAAATPLKLSASGMYTISGADEDSYQIENPALNSYTIGLGGRYGIGKRFGITAGWAGNFTIEDQTNFTLLNPPPKADLEKRVLIYALGIDYRFF